MYPVHVYSFNNSMKMLIATQNSPAKRLVEMILNLWTWMSRPLRRTLGHWKKYAIGTSLSSVKSTNIHAEFIASAHLKASKNTLQIFCGSSTQSTPTIWKTWQNFVPLSRSAVSINCGRGWIPIKSGGVRLCRTRYSHGGLLSRTKWNLFWCPSLDGR